MLIPRRLSSSVSPLFACPRICRTSIAGERLWRNLSVTGFYSYPSALSEESVVTSKGQEDELSLVVQPANSIEDRDFFRSILEACSTKRVTKFYTKNFGSTTTTGADIKASPTPQTPISHTFANIAPLSRDFPQPAASDSKSRTRAYIQRLLNQQQKYTPSIFSASTETDWFTPEISEDQVHVALVKIRQVHLIEDEILQGIGRTLVKLNKLGLVSSVVVDSEELDFSGDAGYLGSSRGLRDQAERVVRAIEQQKGHARIIDGACSITAQRNERASHGSRVENGEEVTVTLPNLLVTPLSRGIIPVITPIAYDPGQRGVLVKSDSIILALTRLLSVDHDRENEPRLLSLDRIIFLDPLGGIPSRDRPQNTAHVFLNLEQEFEAVKEELRAPLNSSIVPPSTSAENIHIQNLVTLRAALALLPPTSSALITTPVTAATTISSNSNTASSFISPSSGPITNGDPATNAPTRFSTGRNPLIYNLLTDKPVFSSSLPINDSIPCTNTTLLKHGIPLSIYTNPPYLDSADSHTIFTLKDGTVDLDKLIYLIEDSFGRTLDVDTYLSRVNNHMAGLIIAGDYEGAAIITWEDGKTSESGNMRKRIPYLDKFAVLRRSQGTGGVADVIFKAMVIGLYPDGIVWRSRKNNPVNKWYFERAKGSWKLPGTMWTMFWTGDVDPIHRESFEQYVDICRNIEPSFKN